jgi:rhomboid family GlyGly-CTERM serine protease
MKYFWERGMRKYGIYLAIILVVVLLNLFDPLSSEYLRFDRELIDAGEVWRLFGAHFVHLSTIHMLGNLLAVCLVAYIAGESLNNLTGVLLLLWCVGAVGVGLYFFASDLSYYVGLSGVLHGLLVVSPFISKFYSRKIAFVFLFAVVLKVAWEQTDFYDDMALASTIGGRVEARAHLLGVLSGLMFLGSYLLWRHFLVKDKKLVKNEGVVK